ncbi:hypothetical protein Adt_14425 [Abeliophyllum distichum]|uniref:Uncharacterized protein n=1 Tax=Abeliophyllum distichum TaxID=126358 RepID=A0ABD1U0C1_9LAMI
MKDPSLTSKRGPYTSLKPPDPVTKVVGHLPSTSSHTIAGHTPPQSSSIEPQNLHDAADLGQNPGSAAQPHVGKLSPTSSLALGDPNCVLGKVPMAPDAATLFPPLHEPENNPKIAIDGANVIESPNSNPCDINDTTMNLDSRPIEKNSPAISPPLRPTRIMLDNRASGAYAPTPSHPCVALCFCQITSAACSA